MADTVGDFILKRLHEWGVRRIYGFPGDGINGLVGALGRDETIDFIQTRHEEEAAFMACAHAKWTGEVGVCMATSGPGAIHLLNGLYDAKLDHQPVLAIVGQQARAALGGNYQQEVDLQVLFKDVAKDYIHTCMAPEQVAASDRPGHAHRHGQTPADGADLPERRAGGRRGGRAAPCPRHRPFRYRLCRAARGARAGRSDPRRRGC